jgi:hypothetical protein
MQKSFKFTPEIITLGAIKQNKQTPWPLVRERTILTDRPPLQQILYVLKRLLV